MKAKFPEYEFHPLTADEPMMTESQQQEVIEDMAEHGYDDKFPIYLHEGMVFLGRNRYVCAKKAGVIPAFKTISKRDDVEALLHRDANLRKHYTPEYLKKQKEKRVIRVAEMRANGMSQRDIAEKENISHTQVQSDLSAAQLAMGLPTEPKDGKVTGHDGKSYKADPIRKVLCDRCQRVGIMPGCEACKEAKREARKPASKVDAIAEKVEPDEPPTVEEQMKSVNGELESWCRDLMKFLKTLPSDPWLEQHQIEGIITAKLKNACEAVRSCKCSHLCPKCSGGGCTHCKTTGRVPSVIFNSLGGVA